MQFTNLGHEKCELCVIMSMLSYGTLPIEDKLFRKVFLNTNYDFNCKACNELTYNSLKS